MGLRPIFERNVCSLVCAILLYFFHDTAVSMLPIFHF